ncbi:Oxysterol-binding protein OBPa [Elasticomyces elasticus]|nr:Oxysterol-binding protein OBPa [Elasticomyces elasticus]KAK4918266.1 Oxysterol-binding protein OBPa [Elasticomyces elasticus]KAK5758347.1 Oxysterol-binding protein OBPa [Elasticomyces elasticus]
MVLGHRKNSLTSNRSSTDAARDSDAEEDVEVVNTEQGNVLTHIISQLRPGADLSRVTLPTFILEPRSMLERITNFMAHPDILLTLPTIDDPIKRFVAVTKFYLSGWHIKPPGVKKPLNPILGETFTGFWEYPDGTKGYYISEQTSHHPPKSSYFFMAPEHRIRIDGTLKPRSKFLGNSVGSFMEGIAVMRFLNRNERYFITQPNMYARGILFGKMKYELGDHAVVRCPETGLEADIEFKVKGWMGGTYNAIGGYIKDSKSGKNLFELSGLWHGEMFSKDLATGKKELLFDATHAKPSMVKARPLNEQSQRESQRLWDTTTRAIKKADHRSATDEKSRIEDEQRKLASDRGGEENWTPVLFKAAPPGDEEQLDWIINAQVDANASPDKQIQQILAIAPILPGSSTQEAKQQPPEQSKTLSPQQSTQSQQTQRSGNDLIDFGQHDSSASQPQQQQPQQPSSSSASNDLAAGMSGMSMRGSSAAPARQQPVAQQWRNGQPVVRQNSAGTEETFVDAET